MKTKSIVSLVLRVTLTIVFIMWWIAKLGTVSPEMVWFIGGAFHNLGLTFISQELWVTVLWVWELLIWLGLLLGWLTRVAAWFAIIILLGAMNAKWWSPSVITMDIIWIIVSAVIIYLGAGAYSIDFKYCSSGSCCGSSCCSKKNQDKEVIEA